MTLYSIVIPTHNEASFIRECLQSLQPGVKNSANIGEVIVVDNGSTDRTVAIAREFGCRVVMLGAKQYPGVARNEGARIATGQVLVFLDGDVVLTNRWWCRFQTYLDEREYRQGRVTGATYVVSSAPSWLESFWFEPLSSRNSSYINGGNLIVPKKIFDNMGGFDQALETGEDVDFCWRAMRAGVTVQNDCRWIARHEGFPKTAKAFVLREKWHGKGDLRSFARFTSSKMAIGSVLFLIAHGLVLAGLSLQVFGVPTAPSIIVLGLIAVVMITGVRLLVAYRPATLKQFAMGFAISYLYLVGRCLSLWALVSARGPK